MSCSVRPILYSAFAFCIAIVLAAQEPAPADAAAGNIRSPFPVGQAIYVFQGYNSGTHTGTSSYGLDLTVSASSTSTAGTSVIAPLSGTIYYWQSSYGNLCVNTNDGRSFTLTHIKAAKTSGSVSAGERLGSVAEAGAANNNGVAHLHFEMWSGPGCYDQSTPIPLDSSHQARLCGAPDFYADGPNAGNGTWSHTTFEAETCTGAQGRSVDFNGDGKSDIFHATGDRFDVSYSGSGGWTKLRDSAATSVLLVGDFNGNGKSDIVQATGDRFQVSYGGSGGWTTLRDSTARSGLLVGDFNGDGKSDIFHATGDRFDVSYSGSGGWTKLRDSTARSGLLSTPDGGLPAT